MYKYKGPQTSRADQVLLDSEGLSTGRLAISTLIWQLRKLRPSEANYQTDAVNTAMAGHKRRCSDSKFYASLPSHYITLYLVSIQNQGIVFKRHGKDEEEIGLGKWND